MPVAVNELRSAALMYEAELQTKLAVAPGLRTLLGAPCDLTLHTDLTHNLQLRTISFRLYFSMQRAQS